MNENTGNATYKNSQADDNAAAMPPGECQSFLHLDLEEYEEVESGAMLCS